MHEKHDAFVYKEIIDALVQVENGGKAQGEVNNWVRRYEVKMFSDEKVLYRRSGKRLAPLEEMFTIIHDSHIRTGHGGRDVIVKDVTKKYPNITREIIMEYLKLCKECALKKGKAKKSVVVQPILSKEMNSRCQVDLIDMQAQADGDYKFILVYQVSF